jgi:hypothetical protein
MKSSNFTRFLAIFLVLSGFIQTTVQAEEVTKSQALAIANRVIRQYFPSDRQVPSATFATITGNQENEPFYLCNAGEKGFVLVAKNDNCPPVLGFSWESSFASRSFNQPVLFNTVLNNIRKQCEDYAMRDSVNPKIRERWQELGSAEKGARDESSLIFPLLATSWNVDSTFFELFPQSFRTGGSVPIAMGQVFRYYGQPATGKEELCYILNGYGELCTKFDQARLRFDLMSNTVGNSAVDSLIYYMSVTCMLQPDGAALDAYKQTLPLYFGYSADMRMVESWNYNVGDVVLHQLSLRRPVPANWLGQAFVIDGYIPDNLFHFNMGMGGEFNGFYLLDYPVVKVDTDHTLLACYTDYHPKSLLPAATGLNAVAEGDSIRISWNCEMSDSLRGNLVRFVVLRDGLIPIVQTKASTVAVSPEMMGGSSNIRVVVDYGLAGASELSEPFRYISDMTPGNIASLALRQKINTVLGSSDLLRQPFLGELELIRELEITFPDQRGLELLPQLKNLRIDGTLMRTLRDGEYLQRLLHLRFFGCSDFDFTVFGHTRALYQLYGYDFLPFDLYEFRHNADLGMLNFTTIGTNPNMLMDLYGADRYFPKMADMLVCHLREGIGINYEDCFVSKESYLDFYPKIKSSLNLYRRTKPTTFAPCYPVPARNANLPAVSRISWQANFNNQPGVYYNVFVGNNRKNLELVSIFQTDKFFDGTFEPNQEYYWRIEAYHADSTYYSGIYHFSTWQDLPIPFVDRFDEYYSACPVTEESPFWTKSDNTLTGKAVANRNVKFDGFYSLELKPKSEAGLLIKTPVDQVYYIEFRFLNQGGQVTAELLQKSTSTDESIVNAKIEFQGSDTGLLTFEGTSFSFNFIPDKWNRVNISLNMNTGQASFSLNEASLKDWQWHSPMGGGVNTNPFRGIRFVNNAGIATASGFIDNVIIDVQNPLSVNPLLNPEIGMIYVQGSHEVRFTGIQPSAIREITLYDIQGRKLVSSQNPENLTFALGSEVPNGVYTIVLNRKAGSAYSRKIAILR